MKDLISMAIETSCDETSVAVLKNGRDVLVNLISSQIDVHKRFGGVVPEVASRMHLESINNIIEEALEEGDIGFEDLDFISCTKGPGLIGALLVGVSASKALSYSLGIPLVGVNHMQGHICANYISHKELEPPFISLVVSGGHTYLIEVLSYADYNIIGRTKDDAAGESFDKIGRAMGLSYPGGPQIDRLAKQGNPKAVDFPRVMMDSKDYDFSFSGLKTAVLNYINHQKQKEEDLNVEDICASFQASVMDVLVEKSFRLAHEKGYKIIAVSGGVAANSELKKRMEERGQEENIKIYFPEPILCTDNAAMIGCAGYYDFINGKTEDLDMRVDPNLEL
ncbi:tRNA (adenosine(37)-N6)-threonylcarbamoyltransferase complex transferase subunit TsaD [Gallicola sp. Sow4_E12]|uniref:tRNA (adenosine(37)-N6)-threonylcarbamoyltransferase complex transferase subunit TsaD n=1 Tax=Gallicola sp. Sow4_E12 TaxID=3438785 RepID=UPI003F8DEB68